MDKSGGMTGRITAKVVYNKPDKMGKIQLGGKISGFAEILVFFKMENSCRTLY
jgi:hypothetical protein